MSNCTGRISMVSSRLRRFEEKYAMRRMVLAVIGSLALLVFVAIFGLRILIGFSLLVDRIRGTSPQSQNTSVTLQSPVLDPLPEATNSATLTIHGQGNSKATVIVYVKDIEYKKVTASDDGRFSVEDIPVEEGEFTATAKISDDKNNISSVSNIISSTIDRTPPKLEISEPEDRKTVNDGTHRVTVQGITDDDMKVTINGRIVVVKSDGSFTYSFPLNDGENKLTIVSKDLAGNETKVERIVMYQP